MTSDLTVYFNTDEFAETVTYNGSSVTALFRYKRNLDVDAGTDNSDTTMAKAELMVKVSDVASPAYRDTIIVSSVTWRVKNIEYGDGYVWKLNLYQDERPVL